MSWWQGLLLGVVQGLTEFLPISSSGHLVVAEAALGVTTPGIVVEVALHLATLLAVVLVYRQVIWRVANNAARGDPGAWRYIGLLAVATVPAGVVGVLFSDLFERAFDSLLLVGGSFMVTGAVLWSTRGASAGPRPLDLSRATAIGVAQALAILPGISRSGTTIAAALWLKVEAVPAAEFSFLLLLPVVVGAAALQLPALSGDIVFVSAGPLAIGFVAALVSGVVAIRFLVATLRRGAFHRFAPYCWGVGVLTMLWAIVER